MGGLPGLPRANEEKALFEGGALATLLNDTSHQGGALNCSSKHGFLTTVLYTILFESIEHDDWTRVCDVAR